MSPEEFFKAIRAQIEHEDALCNHRMTWFIALNAFLFGAYGFSLSAESGATVGPDLRDTIKNARDAMAALGIMSSVATFFALGAAQLSIYRLVSRWYEFSGHGHIKFPQIIGNHEPNRRLGTAMGALPLYSIPLMCLLTWVGLKIGYADRLIFLMGGIFLALVCLNLGAIIQRTVSGPS